MAKRRLDRAISNKDILIRLQNKGITTSKDLLELNDFQLMYILDERRETVEQLMEEITDWLAPKVFTALDLLRKRQRKEKNPGGFLSTGIPGLDQALYQGYPTGSLTELVGPAGVGKSQMCLMAAAAVCCADLGGVIYLDTERKFSADRFMEILNHFHYNTCGCPPSEREMELLMDKVTIFPIDNSEQLTERLESLDALIAETEARLVILDSVAALARKDFSPDDTAARQELLMKQAAILKQIGDDFEVAVLVVNQVTTVFGSGSTTGEDHGSEEGKIAAALGNSWHHCVSTRLVLKQVASHRSITVQKSPLAGESTVRFIIQASGIHEIDESDNILHQSSAQMIQEVFVY